MDDLLTGKTKEAFEKWYDQKRKKQFSLNYIYMVEGTLDRIKDKTMLHAFYCSPFSMKWGVYLEFFDSVGIKFGFNQWDNRILLQTEDFILDLGKARTRQAAQIEAIKKANDIYNGN